jgi:hypothetical protein
LVVPVGYHRLRPNGRDQNSIKHIISMKKGREGRGGWVTKF